MKKEAEARADASGSRIPPSCCLHAFYLALCSSWARSPGSEEKNLSFSDETVTVGYGVEQRLVRRISST